ncbi:unnamed protein product, partial [Pleuronectes platessa]
RRSCRFLKNLLELETHNRRLVFTSHSDDETMVQELLQLNTEAPWFPLLSVCDRVRSNPLTLPGGGGGGGCRVEMEGRMEGQTEGWSDGWDGLRRDYELTTSSKTQWNLVCCLAARGLNYFEHREDWEDWELCWRYRGDQVLSLAMLTTNSVSTVTLCPSLSRGSVGNNNVQ